MATYGYVAARDWGCKTGVFQKRLPGRSSAAAARRYSGVANRVTCPVVHRGTRPRGARALTSAQRARETWRAMSSPPRPSSTRNWAKLICSAGGDGERFAASYSPQSAGESRPAIWTIHLRSAAAQTGRVRGPQRPGPQQPKPPQAEPQETGLQETGLQETGLQETGLQETGQRPGCKRPGCKRLGCTSLNRKAASGRHDRSQPALHRPRRAALWTASRSRSPAHLAVARAGCRRQHRCGIRGDRCDCLGDPGRRCGA